MRFGFILHEVKCGTHSFSFSDGFNPEEILLIRSLVVRKPDVINPINYNQMIVTTVL